MRCVLWPSLLAIVLLPAATSLRGDSSRADSADNPAYQTWARLATGSTVTHINTTGRKAASKSQPEVTFVSRLQKVTPAEITIRVSTTIKIGNDASTSHSVEKIPARVKASASAIQGFMRSQIPAGANVTDSQEGKEVIEVDGNKFECETLRVTYSFNRPDGKPATNAYKKIWASADVPGCLVKSVTWLENETEENGDAIILTKIDAKTQAAPATQKSTGTNQ